MAYPVGAPDVCSEGNTPGLHTGFSPFKLSYGRRPRGILDLVKEKWESGKDEAQSYVKQSLEMRERLTLVSGLAKEALGKAQSYQKARYDRMVRPRTFETGQRVILFLPSDTVKLFAKWQGPYKVLWKVKEVDYEIETPDRKKHKQVFHANLLRA